MSVCTSGRLSYQYWLNGYIRHWVYAYEYGEQELMKLINNASANDNLPDSDEGVS